MKNPDDQIDTHWAVEDVKICGWKRATPGQPVVYKKGEVTCPDCLEQIEHDEKEQARLYRLKNLAGMMVFLISELSEVLDPDIENEDLTDWFTHGMETGLSRGGTDWLTELSCLKLKDDDE